MLSQYENSPELVEISINKLIWKAQSFGQGVSKQSPRTQKFCFSQMFLQYWHPRGLNTLVLKLRMVAEVTARLRTMEMHVMELSGFEPLTLSMPLRCATNCAIAPCAFSIMPDGLQLRQLIFGFRCRDLAFNERWRASKPRLPGKLHV